MPSPAVPTAAARATPQAASAAGRLASRPMLASDSPDRPRKSSTSRARTWRSGRPVGPPGSPVRSDRSEALTLSRVLGRRGARASAAGSAERLERLLDAAPDLLRAVPVAVRGVEDHRVAPAAERDVDVPLVDGRPLVLVGVLEDVRLLVLEGLEPAGEDVEAVVPVLLSDVGLPDLPGLLEVVRRRRRLDEEVAVAVGGPEG